ncbi:alpha/beta hydrolase [Micromonospora endolithica]|uniref:Alpha/beta hydrolase n=1 Tax=Micromonospora endolithica TaxID=230091 RepID=A0A3A9ZK73_9ACTN|nr:alpha/beta hydrolase [Micromonospora endolithica]RKN47797.1 alpha/beta hydrolase [Micromonospora endolithica]TWJ21479.1 acetyl esterase/lipase [Micromonospora endolithica]
MPIGYLVTVAFVAWCVFFGVVAPRRPGPLGTLSFAFGLAVNEVPFLAAYWLLGATVLSIVEDDIDTPAGWLVVALAAVTTAGLVVIAVRGARAARTVREALSDALGAGWRDRVGGAALRRLRPHRPIARILLAPFAVRRRDVQRIANLSYGPAGTRNLLDVYRHRSRPTGGPVLVHLHRGGFVSGRKNREARPLLYRLAGQGWMCVSANYRLRPEVAFPEHLVDVKKVIAWVRAHAAEYGGDPEVIVVAGSSAGGHLAVTAALTANDPAFQPGFTDVDTSVVAAVSLYGYYGSLGGEQALPSAPGAYAGPDAPPLFLAHGDRDTVVHVEGVRDFVDRVRDVSANPVVYAELRGGQHSFDLFHSLRFDAVVDGVEAFAAWVLATRSRPREDARDT